MKVIHMYCHICYVYQRPKLNGANVAPDQRIRASSMLLLLTTRNLKLGNLEKVKWKKLNYNKKYQNVCFFVRKQAWN